MGEEIRKVTCIICPMGCKITVRLRNGKIVGIEGASCPRGKDYAVEEITSPKRYIMSVIKCRNGDLPTVSVKTDKPVPKDMIWKIMDILSRIEVEAPVEIGNIVVENILGLGVNIIATRPCRKVQGPDSF